MSRFAIAISILAAVAVLVAIAAAPSPATAQRDVMQCMERCLRHEGRDAKDTCKLRCADLPAVTGRERAPGQGDCMARYKACQRDCRHDRECHRACKDTLMACR